MVLVATAVPTPVDVNPAWQQLNKALGANLTVNLVPQPDYAARWGAVTAGGDLPDVMYVSIVPVLLAIQAFQKSLCAELTPYLGGDAVKDYPSTSPTSMPLRGGSACSTARYGAFPFHGRSPWPADVRAAEPARPDRVPTAPRTIDDFTTICKQLTRPEGEQAGAGGDQ